MTVLALHGFLGQGSDWQSLRSQISAESEWYTPSLFHPETPWQLANFDQAVDSFLENFNGPSHVDLLIGYSFGGRLALELLKRQPNFAKRVLLLSTHLGGLSEEALAEKSAKDEAWAMKFLSDDLSAVLNEWSAQDIFASDLSVQRNPIDFDRRKLYLALTNLSLASQSLFLTIPKDVRSNLQFAVGEQDKKFMDLYANYQSSGWIGEYSVVPGGHRVHMPPSQPLVERVADLVNAQKM